MEIRCIFKKLWSQATSLVHSFYNYRAPNIKEQLKLASKSAYHPLKQITFLFIFKLYPVKKKKTSKPLYTKTAFLDTTYENKLLKVNNIKNILKSLSILKL